MDKAGVVALMGSGETSPAGGQVFDAVASRLSRPLTISIMETPAGFELNSERVAGKVAQYVFTRLQNYQPKIQQIKARHRGTPLSPDSPQVVEDMIDSEMIFMGPGSPTYAIRQLQGSLAWQYLQALHRLGAAVVLASAATISIGCCALPVYEIYKVGEDPHWKPGLDFFGPYGLSLAFIPHWNNTEGGSELDTSHCFIGQERFDRLRQQLAYDTMVVGLDEHTGLILDLDAQSCQVIGRGQIHLVKSNWERSFQEGASFSLRELGDFRPLTNSHDQLDEMVFRHVAQTRLIKKNQPAAEESVPGEVIRLVELRQAARSEKRWTDSDRLRNEIAAHGWKIKDTADGPRLERA